jgi:uncharacterized protein
MRALLEVNVLIALLDAAHVHHRLATAWLGAELKHGWASCPITQIGCVRIMSQPAYPGALRAAEIAARLGEACADEAHVFWPDSLDLLGGPAVRWPHVLGHRQVTEAYLPGAGCQERLSLRKLRWPHCSQHSGRRQGRASGGIR